MSLGEAIPRNDYLGNGAVDEYDYTFYIRDESHLDVTRFVRATGVETPLVLNSDYTVSGVGEAGGGHITLSAGNLPSTDGLVIIGSRPYSQDYDISGTTGRAQIESSDDDIVRMQQQLEEKFTRAVSLPKSIKISDFDPTLPPVPVAGNVLVVNEDANGFEYQETIQGPPGPQGPAGADGADGAAGAAGADGQGVPTGGTTGQVLKKVDGTDYNTEWADESGGAGLTDSDYGDIVVSGTGTVMTIDANAVDNTKLAQMATETIKGNKTGATADPGDLTGTEVTALLDAVVGDSGSGGTKGLVPAPASGDAAAGKYLAADGTWSAPSGSDGGAWGDITGTLSDQTDLQAALDAKADATDVATNTSDISALQSLRKTNTFTGTTIAQTSGAMDETFTYTGTSAQTFTSFGTLASITDGYRCRIIGTDDTNTLTIPEGSDWIQNGEQILGLGEFADYEKNATIGKMVLMGRSA